MIWYSLKKLEATGFEEAIVIVQEHFRNDVANIPQKYGLSIRLDLVTIPRNEEFGTADSLRLIHDKIKTDVMVVSCDLITDVALHNVFDMHRTHRASVTALFCPLPTDEAAAPIPGPKAKYKRENDLIGLDQQTSRLVFFASETDFEEELDLSKSVLRLFPKLNIQSQLVDAHLYILERAVFEYVVSNRALSMLKGEALPHIVRKQFHRPSVKKAETEPDPSFPAANIKRDLHSFVTENEEDQRVREMSQWNDHRGNLLGPYQDHSIRCYAYVMKDGFCLRANTIASFCELNRQVVKRWSSLFPDEEMAAPPQGKAQVGTDCLIGEGTHLSDKCSIKHSVLGQNCTIEDKVRIINCVLMDNVTVKEGTSLQGSILLDKQTIESRCDIKDCIVGLEHPVHCGSKSTNENLVDGDRLMKF